MVFLVLAVASTSQEQRYAFSLVPVGVVYTGSTNRTSTEQPTSADIVGSDGTEIKPSDMFQLPPVRLSIFPVSYLHGLKVDLVFKIMEYVDNRSASIPHIVNNTKVEQPRARQPCLHWPRNWLKCHPRCIIPQLFATNVCAKFNE